MSRALITASTLLQTVVFALLLWRLCRAGIAGTYRAFTGFVLFETARILSSSFLPRNSDVYAWFYLVTEPLTWLLYALVTLEIYQSVFRTLPGISKLSRYAILTATGIAVTVSTLSLMLQADTASKFPTLELYFTLERSIFLSLLTFVLMVVVFLAFYPVPVHKNAAIYSGVFALYFGVKTGAFLVRTLGGPDYALPASLAGILASITSGLLWATLLSRAGEMRRARSGRSLSEGREKQLVAQLQSFSDSLLRSVPDGR